MNASSQLQRLTLRGAIRLATGIMALLIAAWQLWQGNSEMAARIHDRLDRIETRDGVTATRRGWV